MSVHPPEDRLQDYLDDLLCREERAELEQHLAQCEACRLHVLHERELQRQLFSLPRELQPERDLLPDIHARLAASPPQPRSVSAALWRVRYPLAAAALVLVALTATLTTLLLRREADAPETPLAATRSYEAAADELQHLLRQQVLPAVARPQLDASLRALDAAIAETQAALRDDPANTSLLRLIGALQQQKLELLRSATRPRRTT